MAGLFCHGGNKGQDPQITLWGQGNGRPKNHQPEAVPTSKTQRRAGGEDTNRTMSENAAKATPLSSRAYARVLVPFVLSTMTQPLLGVVDTAIMGHMSNPSYIAGVAVGAVIFNTIYWLLGFLRVGSTGFSAQAGTSGSATELYKALLVPGVMAMCLSCVLLALQWPIFQGAMLIMTLDEATREVAWTYYSILIWGAPLVLGNYALLGWLMGLSRIRESLVMQMGSNVLNMILALLLVPVLGFGVEGVAVATLVSQAFAFAVGLVAAHRALPPLPCDRAERKHLLRSALNWQDMLAMARVNANLLLRTICMLAQTNIFMATASTFGTTTLSANAVLVQILLVFTYVFEGIANASSVFAGQARGLHRPELMDAVYRITLRWTLASGLFMTLICALWHTPMLSLFTDLEDVIQAAQALSLWSLFFPLVSGPGLTVYGLFTGASVTRPVFVSTLQALLAFGAVWALAVPILGNNGLWLAYIIFYLGRSVFLLPHVGKLRAVCAQGS